MAKGQSGKVVGVIIPPPEIRAVVDKTAQFVAKNGKSFEQKIMEKDGSGKFNFMRDNDPYNAYYEFKIKEFEEGGGAPKPAAKVEEKPEAAPAAAAAVVRKQKISALAKALTSKPTGPPPKPVFSLVTPPIIGWRSS